MQNSSFTAPFNTRSQQRQLRRSLIVTLNSHVQRVDVLFGVFYYNQTSGTMISSAACSSFIPIITSSTNHCMYFSWTVIADNSRTVIIILTISLLVNSTYSLPLNVHSNGVAQSLKGKNKIKRLLSLFYLLQLMLHL